MLEERVSWDKREEKACSSRVWDFLSGDLEGERWREDEDGGWGFDEDLEVVDFGLTVNPHLGVLVSGSCRSFVGSLGL